MAIRRSLVPAFLGLLMVTLSGCNGKEVEALRQQVEALQAKNTQAETRLGTLESQVVQLTAELNRAKAAVEELASRAAAAKAKSKTVASKAVLKSAAKKAAAPKAASVKAKAKKKPQH